MKPYARTAAPPRAALPRIWRLQVFGGPWAAPSEMR